MFKKIFVRWQEFAGWLPVVGVLAIVAWVFLGGIDRGVGADTLGLLLELPVLCAYALAALGLGNLARRRFRKKLTEQQKAELWNGVLAGQRGPLFVYLLDTIVWLALTLALLALFWPAR